MKRLHLVVGTFALLAIPMHVATATPVLWSVSIVNPSANMAVAGSFVYDADLNLFADINVSATDDKGISNTTYTVPFPVMGPNGAGAFSFVNSAAADLTGAKFVRFELPTPMTNAGGIIAGQTFESDPHAYIGTCLDAPCEPIPLIILIADTPSSLVGTPAATPVPEPASMTLLGIGLASLGARRWRQRRNP